MNSFLQKYSNPKTLLFLSPILLFIIVYISIGFNGLYGQDSHEYYRYSKAILNYFKTGTSPGDYFWPVYYPAIGAIFGFLIDNLMSLQLLSVLSISGSLFFLYNIISEIFGESENMTIYLLITFLFSPFVLRSSLVVMSDMLTVFLATGSFYFFIAYLQKNEVKQMIYFSICASMAVLTRYAAFVIIIIPAIIIIYQTVKNKKLIHLLIFIVIAILLSLPHILIRETNSTEFLRHSWIQNWSFSNFFKSDFSSSEGTQHYRFPNIINSFSNIFFPTYLVFGLVLVVLSERNLPNNRFWLISVTIIFVNALFLSGIPFQNHRYLLLSYPFVVISVFPGFQRLIKLLVNKRLLLNFALITMLVLQIFFCIYFFKPVYERNLLEKEIAEFVRNSSQKNVYAFDIDVSFTSYSIDKNVINLWNKRLSYFEDDSIIIFNENKFKVQWANMNPMLNWTVLKTNYNLKELKDFGSGWRAYEIYAVR